MNDVPESGWLLHTTYLSVCIEERVRVFKQRVCYIPEEGYSLQCVESACSILCTDRGLGCVQGSPYPGVYKVRVCDLPTPVYSSRCGFGMQLTLSVM